jgi:transcriptional regulator with XRE-family HTH domain
MKHKIGERIRKARMLSGLSQQNIADELELTVASYSNIERGVTDITVTRLFQLAKLLNVSVYFLLEENEQLPQTNERENEYHRLLSSEQKIENRLNQHDSEIEWIKSQIALIQSQLSLR